MSAEQAGDPLQVPQVGAYRERGQHGLLPALDLVGDLGPGADQGDVFDQGGGDGGDRGPLVARQVVILDRGGLGLVAHPGEHLVVVVDAARTHAADVQGEGGPEQVGRPFEVVIDDDPHGAADDVEGVACVPGAGAGKARGEGGGVEVVHAGREEDRVPAVGDLGREGDVLGALRAEVD